MRVAQMHSSAVSATSRDHECFMTCFHDVDMYFLDSASARRRADTVYQIDVLLAVEQD
jgi:hypothetical protein